MKTDISPSSLVAAREPLVENDLIERNKNSEYHLIDPKIKAVMVHYEAHSVLWVDEIWKIKSKVIALLDRCLRQYQALCLRQYLWILLKFEW